AAGGMEEAQRAPVVIRAQAHDAVVLQPEELLDEAVAAIEHAFHLVAAAQAVAQIQSGLLLLDRLPGVEREGRGVGLPRVLLELAAAQAQRILRLRLVEKIADERDRS